MLHFVRRHAKSKVIWVVVAVIIMSFVFFGADMTGSAVNSVAIVGDSLIEPLEVRRAEFNLVQFYRSAYKERFTPEVRASLNLRQRALDELIDRTVLINEARSLGLEISDAELRDAIVGDPNFFQDGRFDPVLYKRMVRSSLRVSLGDYEESRREGLVIDRLRNLVEDGALVGDAVVRDAVLGEMETRTFTFVKLPTSEFELEVDVDDEEALAAVYEENKAKYEIPERVQSTLLVAEPEALGAQAEIADEEVVAFYEDRKEGRFTQPYEVHARHILIRVDAGADDEVKQEARERLVGIAERVREGEDFATLAEEYSQDPGSASKGGDLGFFAKGRMVPEFEEVAFALAPNETSDIVESPYGFHLIRVDEVREERVKPLEEVSEEIVAELKLAAGGEAAESAAEAAHAALEEGKAFDDVAAEYGLTTLTPQPFAKNAPIDGVGRSFPLSNALFGLEAGSYTEAVSAGGKWVIARLDEKIPAQVPPLEEVRMRVRGDLRMVEGQKLGEAAAARLLAAASDLGSLEEAAEAAGRTVETSAPLTRQTSQIPGMGIQPDIVAAVFSLDEAKPVAPKPFTVLGDSLVVGLGEVDTPSEEEIAEESDEIREVLLEQSRRRLLQQYIDELKARADIRVDVQRLEGLPPV